MNQDKKNITGNNTDNTEDKNAEITPLEESLLDNAGTDSPEDEGGALDDWDEDGEPLNEKTSATDPYGADLDVPGSELDDADEAIGEEDEENNSYSVADTDS